MLADLLGGTSPPHDVVLTGPRGAGKTVLLNRFERACRDHEPDVDVLKLTPSDIPTRDALIEVLAPPSGIAKLLPRKLGVAAVGSVEWAPPSGGVRNLRAELTARCRRKPLAALLDEAHTLGLEVGRTLLNASQQVRVRSAGSAGPHALQFPVSRARRRDFFPLPPHDSVRKIVLRIHRCGVPRGA